MSDALVLNASFEPLCVVSQRRAVVLVLTDKAIALEDSTAMVHSARLDLPAPSVLRLIRFVRVPYRATVPLTRKGVLARDLGRCCYCAAVATSLDHVIPKSRGGPHTWENVVAACGRCNHVKADRSLAELGWKLRTPARAPSGAAWRILGSRRGDPQWRRYLVNAEVDEELRATA